MKKVVIIGGGPGGYVAAIRLGNLNFDVTLIEKDKITDTVEIRKVIEKYKGENI